MFFKQTRLHFSPAGLIPTYLKNLKTATEKSQGVSANENWDCHLQNNKGWIC